MPITEVQKQQRLDELLSAVQEHVENEVFIYGVTSRLGRTFPQKINDFLIDHSRIPVRDKAYFFDLMGIMLQAGIAINKALKILITKTENPRLKRIVATLSYELEHGKPLSSAMDRFPDVFDGTERGVIRSAETIGNLENILFKLAAGLEKRSELYMRLRAALIYPCAVMIALLAGVTVILVFVVPKLKELFAEGSIGLPLTTKILIAASLFLSQAWWFLLIVIILAVIAFNVYLNSDEGRFAWDFRKLKLPIAGRILRKMYVLRFTEMLGLLVESGLPINKSLEFTASSIGNEVYRLKTYEALASVQEGQKLSASLSNAPFLFPDSVANMIAVGEQSASMGDLCQKIGAQIEKEIDYTLKNATSVLGPLLILVIGAGVAFFALAVLSPVFTLTQNVQ